MSGTWYLLRSWPIDVNGYAASYKLKLFRFLLISSSSSIHQPFVPVVGIASTQLLHESSKGSCGDHHDSQRFIIKLSRREKIKEITKHKVRVCDVNTMNIYRGNNTTPGLIRIPNPISFYILNYLNPII